MKKVLITGHNGLLGSACVREFSADHEVLTTDIDLSIHEDVLAAFSVLRPDIIIHCAAKVGGVKANHDNPVQFMLENLNIQNAVISAAHECEVRRLCFIGTSCMFPKDAELPVHESSLFTGKLEDSVEAYAIAKIAGWRLCKAYWEQHGDRFITVAPSNIFGLNDNYGPDAHVIPALIHRLATCYKENKPMEVWGDGTAVREFIYADDAASAIRLLISHWKSPEVVNIGTGIGTTISELVAEISVTAPIPNPPYITWNPSKPTGIPRKTFNIDRLKELGWKPKFSLREGLKLTWADYMKGNQRGV